MAAVAVFLSLVTTTGPASAGEASSRMETDGIVRIEGAWPKFHNWTKLAAKMAYGPGLELREILGVPDAAGYRAGYEFTVPTAGRYRLWLVGLPIGENWASPIQITLNGKKLDLGNAKGCGAHPTHTLSLWSQLCDVDLAAGRNDLIALVIQRRTYPDNEFCFYIDEFVLTPLDWELPSDRAPILPPPRNTEPEDTKLSFQVDAAEAGPAFPPSDYALCQGAGPSDWPAGSMDTVLPQVKPLGPKFFRKDNFSPECTKVNGEWRYDFTKIDRIVDEIRAMGAEVIPCLEGAGPAGENVPAGKVFNLAGWEAYWYQVVKHFNVDRKLGIRYWEVLNEPDGRGAWYGKQYVEIFDHAQRGVRRADPKALVGGPACIGHDGATPFVEKCVAAGIKPGFVSYHTYGVPGEQFVDIAENIRGTARELTGNPELPLLVTEWGITSTCCKYWWNTLAPAFDASVYVAMARRPGCPDIATRFSMKDHFPGAEFGMFNLQSQPYPSFFSAKLFWGMSGHVIPLTGDRSESSDGLATRDGDSVKAFLWNMEREGSPRRTVELKILGLGQVHYRWRRAVVDPYCTNPYNRRHADPETNALAWTSWQTVSATEGSLDLGFEMVPPGVTLVQVVVGNDDK